MNEEFPPDVALSEKNTSLHDLELAREENHFKDADIQKIHITGSSENREYVTNECRHLLALCELFDMKPEMIGIHGTIPVVFIDIHPTKSSGEGGKYGIIEYRKEEIVMKDGKPEFQACEKFVADFDITVWNVPAEEKVSRPGPFTETKWECRL